MVQISRKVTVMNGNKPIEQIMEKCCRIELKWKVPLTKAKNGVENYCITKITMQEYISLVKKKQGLRL